MSELENGYLDIKQITLRSGVSARSVRRAISAGALTPLPESRRARRYVFDAQQVDVWLAHRPDLLPRCIAGAQ